VIICGYSLPDNDRKARAAILTAFQVNEKAQWLVIDPSQHVCERYTRLLGEKRLTTMQKGLAGFNHALYDNLQNAFKGIPLPPKPAK
jgi:hypothetical protein